MPKEGFVAFDFRDGLALMGEKRFKNASLNR
jgi:hypothetical protein